MCEAHWPFDACSYGGQCNETLGVCVCNEGYGRSSRLFDLDEFDCVVPDKLFDVAVNLGLILSALSIVSICWTTKSKNYFARLKDTRSPALARRYQQCAAGTLGSSIVYLLFFARLRSAVPHDKRSFMTDIYLTMLYQAAGVVFWLYLLDFYLIHAANVVRLSALASEDIKQNLMWAKTRGWHIMVMLTLVLGIGTPIAHKLGGTIVGVQFNMAFFAVITVDASYIGITIARCLVESLDAELGASVGDVHSSFEHQRVKLTKLRRNNIRFIGACKHAVFSALVFTLLFFAWPWTQAWTTVHALYACNGGVCFNIYVQHLLPRVLLKPSRKNQVSGHSIRALSSPVLSSEGPNQKRAPACVVSDHGPNASSSDQVADEAKE